MKVINVSNKPGICVCLENFKGEKKYALYWYEFIGFFQDGDNIYAYPMICIDPSEPVEIVKDAIFLEPPLDVKWLLYYVRGCVLTYGGTVDTGMDRVEDSIRLIKPEFELDRDLISHRYKAKFENKK